MPHTILITGANRGLGLEFTQQFLGQGHVIHALCRDTTTADALTHLKDNDTLHLHRCDVTSQSQLNEVKQKLANIPIDIIINNAGIYGTKNESLDNVSISNLQQVFAVNTFAPLQVAQCFHDNLRAGREKLLVNITSRMGSIADNTSGGRYAYRGSKAALNCMMHSLAIDLAGDDIRVLLLHPGWVQTDMGGQRASLSASESVSAMMQLIQNPETVSGAFYHCQGEQLPW